MPRDGYDACPACGTYLLGVDDYRKHVKDTHYSDVLDIMQITDGEIILKEVHNVFQPVVKPESFFLRFMPGDALIFVVVGHNSVDQNEEWEVDVFNCYGVETVVQYHLINVELRTLCLFRFSIDLSNLDPPIPNWSNVFSAAA